MVAELPAKVTVKEVFNRFIEFKNGQQATGGGDGASSSNISSSGSGNGDAKGKEWSYLCDSLIVTFETALPVMLLYKEERPQYENVVKNNSQSGGEGGSGSGSGSGEGGGTNKTIGTSSTYGLPHLLRLFTRLPSLLTTTSLTAAECKRLSNHLNELLKFVNKICPEVVTEGGTKYRKIKDSERTAGEKKIAEIRREQELKEQQQQQTAVVAVGGGVGVGVGMEVEKEKEKEREKDSFILS